MSGMPGYDLWLTTDTAYEDASRREDALDSIRDRLINDPAEIADIDVIASEELDGETYTNLLSVLADACLYRVLDVITNGGSMGDLVGRQQDVYDRLVALSDQMLEARNVELEKVAESALEDRS